MPENENNNSTSTSDVGNGDSGESSGREGPETFTKEYVDKLRKENATYRSRAKEAEGKVEKLETEAMTAQEKAIEAAKKEARAEVESVYKRRLGEQKVKAQAAGEFADPDDALRHLDLDKLDLDDDYAIGEALLKLLKDKPYLAAESRKPTEIDQGPRGKQTAAATGSDWLRGISGRG